MIKLKNITTGILLISLFLFQSCDQGDVSLPQWLEGTWVTGDTLGFTTERWEVISGEFMSGEGLFLMSDGTTVIEILSIFIKDGILFYTAMLPNQNDGVEIMFIETMNQPDSLVFENPAHDYPKKIVYRKVNDLTVDVFIHGEKEDKPQHIILTKADQ